MSVLASHHQAYLACALFSSGQAMLFIFYPYLAFSLGLTLSEVIACFTAGSLLFLIGSPFWAHRSGAWGRERCIQLGILGLFLSFGALILLIHRQEQLSPLAILVFLALSRIFYGLSASAIVPVSQALLADGAKQEGRMRALTNNSIALNIGRLLGPLLALSLLPLGGSVPLYVFTGILLLALLLGPRTGTQVKAKTEQIFVIWPQPGGGRLIFVLALLTTAYVGLIQSSLAAWIQSSLRVSLSDAAILMSQLLLGGVLMSLLVQTLAKSRLRDPWKGSMLAGALGLSLAAVLLLSLANQASLWLAIICLFSGLGLLTPSYMTAMSLYFDEKQNQAAASLGVAHTLGYAIGGGLSAIGFADEYHSLPMILALALSGVILGMLPAIHQIRVPLLSPATGPVAKEFSS